MTTSNRILISKQKNVLIFSRKRSQRFLLATSTFSVFQCMDKENNHD